MTDVSEAGSRTDAAVGPMRLSPISQTSTQAARLFRRLIVKDRIGWRPSFARGTRALKLQRQSREKPHSQRQKKNDELLSPFFLVPSAEQKHSMFLRLITLLFFSGRGIAFTYAKSSWNNKRAFVPRGGSSSVKAAPTSSAAASSISPPFNDTFVSSSEVIVNDPSQNRGPLRVLFLSSDTGGGHRASAESLAKQFQIHFPGSTYELVDVWTDHGCLPYRTLVDSYKHLSAHPRQWRFLYHLSNSRPWEIMTDFHSTLTCERKIRRRLASLNPDVIVSVHPAMNNAPMIAARKISKAAGKHIPFFTVVTDLGSAHCTWFQKRVERIYIASERLRKLCKRRGRTPDENIVMSGLPIRHDFAVQAEAMGDRTSDAGKAYQKAIKEDLNIDTERPMVLVMGGGEGVGSLSDIVNELYTSFTKHGVDATIYVVCGRNQKLKNDLSTRDWSAVSNGEHKPKKRFRLFRRRRSKEIQKSLDEAHDDGNHAKGKVDVVGLGFVTNMAEYMVAADVLVTKAGPGTIAEAAAVGLPIMLTSFLPGQEAGNVDFVLEKGFGDFCDDPVSIGEEVAVWLQDYSLLTTMSHKAQEAGSPHAAADIVLDIGSITHTWKALNGDNDEVDTSTLSI